MLGHSSASLTWDDNAPPFATVHHKNMGSLQRRSTGFQAPLSLRLVVSSRPGALDGHSPISGSRPVVGVVATRDGAPPFQGRLVRDTVWLCKGKDPLHHPTIRGFTLVPIHHVGFLPLPCPFTKGMKMAGVWEVSQSETHQTNEIGMEDRNNLSRASSYSHGSDVEEEGWQSGTSWRSTGDQEWPVKSNPSVLARNRSFQPDQTKYGFLPGENYLIHPESMQHRIWWAFIAFMAAFTALYVPYSVGFATYNSVPPYGSGAGAMQILLDVVFFMDMLVQFNLAFRVENTNELIVDRRTIATRYLGGKFGVDLIGLFPFHPLVLGIAGKMQQPTSKFGMYSSLTRLLQLVRIYRMGQLQEKLLFWQALSFKDIIIARIVLVLFFLGNIFACGFYFIAILEGVDVDSFMSEFLSLHGPLNGFQRYL